jgi:hypothetical protein
VRTAGNALTFFPRASGGDSAVEAAAFADGADIGAAAKPAASARLQGKAGEWSPISARWTLPLTCLNRGEPPRVRVTLQGPWAQLWVRDGAAFF